LESQGKCQHDSDGHLIRLMGVVTDVTQRRRSEEAMLRSEKLAIAGRLAASVAHEINNPLEAVSNLLFLITIADSLESVREHARYAMDQLMRVSLITQQTLKFHRQGGQARLTHFSEVLEAALVMFRAKLNAAGVIPDVRVENELAVVCMPGELHQIFANLISNSIEAMPQGGRLVIRIRPSLDWRDGKTEGMRITFADSGTGMDKAIRHRVFEPFFTTKTDTGTGLGMWVVAQLLERPHGEIRVWSTQRAGRSGTAFSVFHPLASPAKATGSPEPTPPESGVPEAAALEQYAASGALDPDDNALLNPGGIGQVAGQSLI
jgi:two-component system CheB/CheR fusion protein